MVGVTASCAKERTEVARDLDDHDHDHYFCARAVEKSINPTGGNLFTPPVYAPPAPTEPPGVHRHNN
jgi:hypothetical protein